MNLDGASACTTQAEIDHPSAAESTITARVMDTASTKAPKVSKKTKAARARADKDCRATRGRARSKRGEKDESSDDDSSSSSDDMTSEDSDSSDESSESSEEETAKQRKARRRKEKKQKKSTKAKKSKKADKAKGKGKKAEQHSSSTSSSADGESDAEPSDADEAEEGSDEDDADELQQILRLQKRIQLVNLKSQMSHQTYGLDPLQTFTSSLTTDRLLRQVQRRLKKRKSKKTESKEAEDDKTEDKEEKSKIAPGTKLEFKRVDELWDSSIHDYKLTETAEHKKSSDFDQYLFNVRRSFDFDGEYVGTFVDIRSKLIKEALTEIMEDVKGVSLAEETPAINPNFLFLYEPELRALLKGLKTKLKNEKMKRKLRKHCEEKVKHLKILLKYLDKDFSQIKKTLYPMLEAGLITFDLLWALYKPNTLVYSTTYGVADEARAFRIVYAEKLHDFMKGDSYAIEGKYLEHDGKTWGMGRLDSSIPAFKGARKITSLDCYPLEYHKDEVGVRAQLIARGRKFVSLQGVHYKSHQGLAFYKKKKQVVKVNVNGRIMVDPSIHRRINPNYQVSTVTPKITDDDDSLSDSDSDDCCQDASSGGEEVPTFQVDEDRVKTCRKVIQDDKKKSHIVTFEVDEDGNAIVPEKLTEISHKQDDEDTEKKSPIPVFTDEEYLMASPVVLGFAFAEKLWLEFTVSGIKDIVWNEGAYESLVLENNTKDIVRALVESHKYHPTQSIDDVIQGKGKGLVAVLHGPPGTGKTLTAEGISELLKCPLYMVTAGELGTDPRTLEFELQKILDIAHAWGAVLLLDEADVFLEKRTIQDIHRNALVSIFLRLLEYFQGILFLTTNRVETFDDAFQSRIHIALRYGDLSPRAKRTVFKAFIERVRVLEGVTTMSFTEEDYANLAKYALNGRQIKNTVRTAQALAVNKGEPLSMVHMKKVLDVALSFERDLKGGTGYEDAMRNYY